MTYMIECWVYEHDKPFLVTLYPLKNKEKFVSQIEEDYSCGTIIEADADVCFLMLCGKHIPVARQNHPGKPGFFVMVTSRCENPRPLKYDKDRDTFTYLEFTMLGIEES